MKSGCNKIALKLVLLHPLYFLLIYNRHKNGIKIGVSTVN